MAGEAGGVEEALKEALADWATDCEGEVVVTIAVPLADNDGDGERSGDDVDGITQDSSTTKPSPPNPDEFVRVYAIPPPNVAADVLTNDEPPPPPLAMLPPPPPKNPPPPPPPPPPHAQLKHSAPQVEPPAAQPPPPRPEPD